MTAIDGLARTRVRIEREVVDCSLGNGLALLNLETGCYFSLGETGAFVWEAIKRDASLETIATDMAREFDVSLDRSRDDLGAFMGQLEKAGLVKTDGLPGQDGNGRG